MFGHASKPSKNFSFGARISGNTDIINEQLFLGNKYRNMLVEHKRNERKEIEDIRRAKYPEILVIEDDIKKLDDEISFLRKEIAEENSKAKKKVCDEEKKNKIKVLDKDRKKKYKCLSELKTIANGELKTEFDEIQKKYHKHKLDALRHTSGLDWGMYNYVESSIKKDKHLPKFHSYKGEGTIAVQIQKKKNKPEMTIATAMSKKDNRLQISQVKNDIYLARIQLAKNKHIEISFVMHRQIPSDAIIKNVYVKLIKVGTKKKCKLIFNVSKDVWNTHPNDLEVIGLDVGWRLIEDKGLRVAYWSTSNGQKSGEILIPKVKLLSWQKITELQSIRQDNFNKMVVILSAWMKINNNTPEWLKEEAQYMHLWKSIVKLAKLAIKWRNSRFEGDECIYNEMEKWRKQDKHLLEWEDNQRKKVIDWRNDFYRKRVYALSKEYRINIEDANWAKIQKNKPVEEDNMSKRYAAMASVGILLSFIKETASHKIVSAKNTSKRCHLCGHICNLGKEQFYDCEKCGEAWDRDVNAAINLANEGNGSDKLKYLSAARKSSVVNDLRVIHVKDPLANHKSLV